AFQETPRNHALAVAVGLIPAFAAWALLLVETSVRAAGSTLFATTPKFGADLFLHGVIALSQGFIITSMLLSAIIALSIDHDFLKASRWAFAGAVLSAFGLIHAYVLTSEGVQNKFGLLAAPGFIAGYTLTGCLLLALHCRKPRVASFEATKNANDLPIE